MASIHNTRLLRFLLVLSAVVLTIFIYASYSSNSALAPPHMRAGGTPSAAVASALGGLQWQPEPVAANRSANTNFKYKQHGNASVGAGRGHDAPVAHDKLNRKAATSRALPGVAAASGIVFVKKQHHREPTIDADAVGGGGMLDDGPDEAALERLVSNDLLEEQYVQNVDNLLGNINNSNTSAAGAAGVPTQQKQQQQNFALQQEQLQEDEDAQPLQRIPSQQQQQQQQQQNQLADSNLNKILDSDVLIPTSNLQKFIENADKILKNITAQPPPAVKSAPAAVANKSSVVAVKVEEPKNSVDDNAGVDDDDVALPPSVVMTIKHGHPPQPSVLETRKPDKTPANVNATTARAAIDPTKGILTQQIYESGHMNEELNIAKLCPDGGGDLKLLILITSALSHAEARMAIRQTWAHYGTRRDVSTAFILGRSTDKSLNVALSQENFIYGDLIRGNFIDSYNNLTLKTISALEWVDQHCARAKYVLKTDDDMFINVPKLLGFLDNVGKEKRVIYGRLAKKWKPIRNKKSKYYVSTDQFSAPVFPPFTTGPAYVISSDAVHDLYVRSLHQVYLKLEDVFTTGIVAQLLGIKRFHVNEFLNRRIAFNPCNIRKTISVHMIKSNEQFDLWKKLLEQNTKCGKFNIVMGKAQPVHICCCGPDVLDPNEEDWAYFY